jgi:hypothetical protein
VQVAVAETHLASVPPLVEQRADARHGAIQRAFEAINLPRIEPGRL